MGENQQVGEPRIHLYNIVIAPSDGQSTYNMHDVSSDIRNGENFERDSGSNNDQRGHSTSSRESRRIVRVSEETRNKVANSSCFCGIFLSAIGGGLVLMFIVAEYSPSLQLAINNYQDLVIPGFVLLFTGIFALLIGIYFCWVYRRRESLTNRSDELEAGFHQQQQRRRRHPGYSNPAMEPDDPPSYLDLAIGQNIPYHLPVAREQSVKLPSYGDVVKKSKPQSEVVDTSPPEAPPPPYSNDQSTS